MIRLTVKNVGVSEHGVFLNSNSRWPSYRVENVPVSSCNKGAELTIPSGAEANQRE